MRRLRECGFALSEIVVSMALLGILMTLSVTLFNLSHNCYQTGSAQADVLSSSQTSSVRFLQELQESDLLGVRINSTRNAIVFISARDSSGKFQTYSSGSQTASYGQPYWQKWVCYYLAPQAGSSYSMLVRKEGNPLGSTLPDPTIPTPPSNWESIFRAAILNSVILARDVQTLDIEDVSCGVTGNPLYVQILSAVSYGGLLTNYNSGYRVNFSCSKTGNWIEVPVRN